MKRILAAATLIALSLGVFASAASATGTGGFCRSLGGEMPVCQR